MPFIPTKMSVLPSPTKWGIHADISGRPIIWGILIINAISNNYVVGTINFRGKPIPIEGSWNEQTKQIRFDSPYAIFTGNLSIYDDTPIRIRHFVLNGIVLMKPPSLQAGEKGTSFAATDSPLSESPVHGKASSYPATKQLPPVGAFLTSNILYGRRRLE